MNEALEGLFDETIELPNANASRRLARLVGLDEVRERLLKEARILINPSLLEEWSKKHYGGLVPLLDSFRDRSPLFIFAGDVGTGKTRLAETFGDELARQERISITLYRLSLSARGTGAVGEMTRLLTAAFNEVAEAARRVASNGNKPRSAVILLVDEADALAQSRELSQMHHEDRAGVNALIRGIDGFADGRLPALAVMCTNRLEAIDPAIKRRAAEIFIFRRPDDDQRAAILRAGLKDLKVTDDEVSMLVTATGPSRGESYGYTYSDLVQRLLPSILLEAFPTEPIRFQQALEIAEKLVPTPPFQASSDGKVEN